MILTLLVIAVLLLLAFGLDQALHAANLIAIYALATLLALVLFHYLQPHLTR